MGFSLLRRTADTRWATELWADARAGAATEVKACPSCRAGMIVGTSRELSLDVCKSCHLVWFDPGEYERAPVTPERGVRTLPSDVIESLARGRAAVVAAEYKIRYGREMTVAEALPLVPGLAGLPLEEESRGLSRWPLVTWGVAVLLTALGVWSLLRPDRAGSLGLIATDIDRSGGATLISATFVHATFFQLATNVYFLLVFGDNVEDFLGPATFWLLLFTGGVVGNVAHAVFASDSAATLMGASGAISAIAVFYALMFPSARLRVVRLLKWHTVPASAGLLFWLLAKLASTQPLFGRAEPSMWPYVGGALIGLIFWAVMREPG